MSTTDTVKFTPLEKPVTFDQNTLQALIYRLMSELVRWQSSLLANNFGSQDALNSTIESIFGLFVSGSAGNISITPGILCQASATLSPVPGTYDSIMRVGLSDTNIVTAAPAPGSDTYYLIEAQVIQDVLVNEPRDVLDPNTGNFVSQALDKVLRGRINTRIRAGSATQYPTPLAPPTPDWIVLAGLFRPAGGGAMSKEQLVDMRKFPSMYSEERGTTPTPSDKAITNVIITDGTENVVISAEAEGPAVPSGQLAIARPANSTTQSLTAASLNKARVRQAALALAADTWYYVYLCEWNGIMPEMYYKDHADANITLRTRGVLVVSNVAPLTSRNSNSANITLPDPFGTVVAAGQARLVTAVRRNTANNGWLSMMGSEGRYKFYNLSAFGGGIVLSSGVAISPSAVPITHVPANAKFLKLYIIAVVDFTGADANSGLSIGIVPSGGASPNLYDIRLTPAPFGDSVAVSQEFEVPYNAAGYDVLTTATGGGGVSITGTVSVVLRGFTS